MTMEKKLVCSNRDVVSFMLFLLGDFDWVERILKIEFPFENGTYQSDSSEAEHQSVRTDQFRIIEFSQFPKQYPCVMCYANVQPAHGGLIHIIDYVYKEDFQG